MPPWLLVGEGRITLKLHVQPNAKKTEIVGLHGDALKIRLAAMPIDGQANANLIALIADRLGLAKSLVNLKTGQSSRRKVIEVKAAPADAARRLLPDR
ncbi:DUF167 domain-containing protein [Propionivibrio sp.]|uniref:DUF167 domain-containing protein n=1 Tax=Propionivibrio sp. TaxID=2212460 RepID=UPI0026063687|nr:DUF167 domain-containing protein [Propionivibrio sp.]